MFDHVPAMLMEAVADDRDEYPDIREMIKRLPVDHAAVLALRYFASLSWEAVAGTLAISTSTAKRRAGEGIDIMRGLMRQN